jgi:protein TonB
MGHRVLERVHAAPVEPLLPTSRELEEIQMTSVLKLSIVLLTSASINACGSLLSNKQAVARTEAKQTSEIDWTSHLSREMCDPNAPSITIDAYKKGVAQHILRSNLGNTFEGRLPPMLPAIVVLRLSVDSSGAVKDVFVQRSSDDVASDVAMASVYRSGHFPSPCGLTGGKNISLSFSETFLFNDQYQFQLRSLADPQ